jgi:hypothetical protein
MPDTTEQAGWAAAAILAVSAIVKGAFARSGKRDNVLVKLITDCERRHDERDGKYAQLELEVRNLAAEHATLKAEHATCAPRIAQLEARLDSERPTDSPPALPVQHKEVGHAE